MKFNRIYFYTIVFLFISLLFSYYYFNKTSPNFLKLWGRIPDSKKNIYYTSVFITLIGFIVFLYYLWIGDSFENKYQTFKLFIILVIFLLLSISWAPLSLHYLNNKSITLKYQIILVMFLIPLSLLYPIYILYKINDKKYTILKNISFGMIIYYCLHTFILDTIIWTMNFF